MEDEWAVLKGVMSKAADEKVGRKTRTGRKPWITEEILGLIDERRKHTNSKDEEGKVEYKRLKNEVNRKCKEAKERWLHNKCRTVELCMAKGKVDAAYRKVKEITTDKKSMCANIKSSDGKPILGKAEKAER